MIAAPEQISTGNVLDYLATRGISLPRSTRISELSGGVSGRCLLIEAGVRRMVVKQALAELAVAGRWAAKTERALTEAAALRAVHRLTPSVTPEVLDVDSDHCTFTMTAAPANFRSWKEQLLTGAAPSKQTRATAAALGRILGYWHRATWGDRAIASRFSDYEAFEQLRIAPFHRRIAAVHSDLSPAVQACVEDLQTRRDCLVHGDFSPKNVLVGVGDPWVVDFEVAHVGAADFDIAFLLCHLLLKAIHQPEQASVYTAAAEAFAAAYRSANPLYLPTALLGWHVASLVLARLDGMSTVAYLSDDERDRARRLSTRWLTTQNLNVTDMWTATVKAA